MNKSEFRPEHFTRGQSFSEADFAQYVRASEKLARTTFTSYLPCVACGLLLAALLSQGVGGAVGNLGAVVAIFAGLIAGGVFNMRAARAVRDAAARLGLTKQDVAEARAHVKNGTVAWTRAAGETGQTRAAFCGSCGAALRPGAQFCAACGAAQNSAESAQNPAAGAPGNPAALTSENPVAGASGNPVAGAPGNPAAPVPAEPRRAVCAAALLAAGWLLLIVLQLIFRGTMRYSADALFYLAIGVLAAACWMLLPQGGGARGASAAIGAGLALAAALLRAWTEKITATGILINPGMKLGVVLDAIRPFSPLFLRTLGALLLAALAAFGAGIGVSALTRGAPHKKRMTRSALAAGGGYALFQIIRQFASPQVQNMLSRAQKTLFANVFNIVFTCIADGVCLFLLICAMDALCRMPGKRVRLHGLGRVWAWIGLIGGAVGLLGVTVLTVFGNRAAAAGNFASPQLLVSLCAIIGYAMLLRNRRAGLYVVGIGALLLLGGQFTDAVGQLVHGYGVAVSRMISALVGALNPLFAVLAVRAGRAEE